MLDRIELISELNKQSLKLNSTAQKGLEQTLNKAIGQMLAGLMLPQAKAASPDIQNLVAKSFEEALSMAELKKISKLWEPKRTLPAGIAQRELASDLVSLMRAERAPFEPTKLSLAQARSLGAHDRADIALGFERYATLTQLKATLKKWDKTSPLATQGDTASVRSALMTLLHT